MVISAKILHGEVSIPYYFLFPSLLCSNCPVYFLFCTTLSFAVIVFVHGLNFGHAPKILNQVHNHSGFKVPETSCWNMITFGEMTKELLLICMVGFIKHDCSDFLVLFVILKVLRTPEFRNCKAADEIRERKFTKKLF